MISKSVYLQHDYILSGNNKEGFQLKCIWCKKEHFNKGVPKFCSKECRKLYKQDFMKNNNPLSNPEIREKQKLASGSIECRMKKSEASKINNAMFRIEVKEKHKKSMKKMTGLNNPLYTCLGALENLRNAAKTEECIKKKSEGTKNAFIKGKHPMCFLENRLKISVANSRDIIDMENFLKYYKLVIKETNKTLVKFKNSIDKYNLRKKFEYELDHKYSIYEGFKNNVDPNIIGHYKNLEILTRKENNSKHTKCSILLEDLIKEIKEFNNA